MLLTEFYRIVFRKKIYLYATAAFCGAGLFLLLRHFFPGQPVNRLIAVGAILLLRLAGIRWKLGLPLFQPRSADAGERKQNEISPAAKS